MKKLFYVLLFLLFSSYVASAQTTRSTEISLPNNLIGVKTGFNLSKIDSDLGANTVRRRAMFFGVFYQYYLSRTFAVQPELQYSSEGWTDDERESKLKYINLSLVGKYYPLGGLNFQGGIQPSVLIDATEEIPDPNSPNLAIDENLDRFNLAAIFGIAYDFNFGLRLGARYIQGLIDINDGININTKSSEIKTTTFQIHIGYGIKRTRSAYGY